MPGSDWKVEPADVGSIIRARTKDDLGNELGTFNAQTRPTDVQALALIQQGISDVVLAVGSDLPQVSWDDARYVAALSAACKIELSFFPEQVASGRSPYDQLKQLYDDQLKRLQLSVTANGGSTPGSEAGGATPLKPSYSFPQPGRAGIQRSDQWLHAHGYGGLAGPSGW